MKTLQKMQKNKAIIRMLLLIMLCTALSGCFGGRETDEVAIVVAVGLDKGEHEDIEVTVTIANPHMFAAGDGGGGGQQEPFMITSVMGPSIWECYILLNTYISRDITLQHANAYIFGEELAREGIGKYILCFLRQREVRRNSNLFVCRGKAKDFLKENKQILEIFPGKQYELMDRMTERTGFFNDKDLYDCYYIYKNLHSNPTVAMVGINKGKARPEKYSQGSLEAPYLPGEVPREEGNKAEFVGTAVFNKDKMVGELTADETRTLLMLQGNLTTSNFTFYDPKHSDKIIALAMAQARNPEIQFSQENGRLKIHQTIYLEGEIYSIQSGEHYEQPDKKRILEKSFERHVERMAQELIGKTKEQDWGDIIQYDRYYRKYLTSWEEWENLPWNDIYNNADISIECKATIRRTGLLRLTEPPLKVR